MHVPWDMVAFHRKENMISAVLMWFCTFVHRYKHIQCKVTFNVFFIMTLVKLQKLFQKGHKFRVVTYLKSVTIS